MEISGKVIIFDGEEDAKEWFKTIQDVVHNNKLETIEAKFQKLIQKEKDKK